MKFEEIQKSFDHGNIILSDGKLSVLYTKTNPGGSIQSFANEPLGTDTLSESGFSASKFALETIIRNADSVWFHVFPEGKMRLDFCVEDSDSTPGYASFPTSFEDVLNQSVKPEDFDFLMDKAREKCEELLLKYDFSDEIHRELFFDEWLSFLGGEEPGEPLTAEDMISWRMLLDRVNELHSALGTGHLEIEEPEDSNLKGYVELYFDTATYLGLEFSGHSKELLANAVKQASVVDFEIVNHAGERITYLTLCFYN